MSATASASNATAITVRASTSAQSAADTTGSGDAGGRDTFGAARPTAAAAPARAGGGSAAQTWLWRVGAALSVGVAGYALVLTAWLGGAPFRFPTNVVDESLRDTNRTAGALHFVFNGLALALGPFQFFTAPGRGASAAARAAGAAGAGAESARVSARAAADVTASPTAEPNAAPPQQPLVPFTSTSVSTSASDSPEPARPRAAAPWHRMWHRTAGWAYVVCAGLGTASSLRLAPTAQGGAVASWAFGALGVYTLASTGLAVGYIVRRRVTQHRAWMTRSFAGLFSAVTLRVYLPILIAAHGGAFEPAYRIVSWLCWVPNALAAEYVIRSQTQTLTQTK